MSASEIRWVVGVDDEQLYWHAEDVAASIEKHTDPERRDDETCMRWIREVLLPRLRGHAFEVSVSRDLANLPTGVETLPGPCGGCGAPGDEDCHDGCRLSHVCSTCGGAGLVPDYEQPMSEGQAQHPSQYGLTLQEGEVWFRAVVCPACHPPTHDVHWPHTEAGPTDKTTMRCECGKWTWRGPSTLKEREGDRLYAKHLERVG